MLSTYSRCCGPPESCHGLFPGFIGAIYLIFISLLAVDRPEILSALLRHIKLSNSHSTAEMRPEPLGMRRGCENSDGKVVRIATEKKGTSGCDKTNIIKFVCSIEFSGSAYLCFSLRLFNLNGRTKLSDESLNGLTIANVCGRFMSYR